MIGSNVRARRRSPRVLTAVAAVVLVLAGVSAGCGSGNEFEGAHVEIDLTDGPRLDRFPGWRPEDKSTEFIDNPESVTIRFPNGLVFHDEGHIWGIKIFTTRGPEGMFNNLKVTFDDETLRQAYERIVRYRDDWNLTRVDVTDWEEQLALLDAGRTDEVGFPRRGGGGVEDRDAIPDGPRALFAGVRAVAVPVTGVTEPYTVHMDFTWDFEPEVPPTGHPRGSPPPDAASPGAGTPANPPQP